MNEERKPDDSRIPATSRSKISTSDKIAATALVISVVAALFGGLMWHEAHNQLLLSMKPTLTFMAESDPDEGPIGLTVINSGPGPAVIKSVTYFMDKRPIGDVTKASDLTPLDVHTIDFDEGDTIGVGETVWLLKHNSKPHEKDQKDVDDFADTLINHLAVQVEFCPVVKGDCGKKCSTKGWCD